MTKPVPDHPLRLSHEGFGTSTKRLELFSASRQEMVVFLPEGEAVLRTLVRRLFSRPDKNGAGN